MATLALSLAGQVVGGAFGGPIGATIGRALGALAGSAIDNAIFSEPARATGSDVRLQGSAEGAPIPRLYGWSRLSGNIIWATELEEIAAEDTGAKGGGDSDEGGVAASFAIGFCEGEVHRLGRVWADSQLLDTAGIALRFYRGSETQAADSLIEARQGADAPCLSWALLRRVRTTAARAIWQPHSQYLGRAVPCGRRSRAGDPGGDGDPRRE